MSVCPSASVAETALPISTPEPVFSTTEREVLLPSVNTGALLAETPLTSVSWFGNSSTSVMWIVTAMKVVILVSETVTDTL